VGIGQDDVITILGRAPDVFVPSDRDITRSINEGRPIVLSQKRSGAARAFQELAQLYLPTAAPRESGVTARSRRRFARA
jgi:MinD-like ATPase involved in chromosome partitioning or flagellar assembly